ncbi:GIY-YIG nuclease family protein [Halomicrococcus sp. NG-SE-24]|uniref:GIY-YIG nuclease family protein n=1 Tax=Halomicrococcus sp. NG-SE-24 TaxID=3436928 RepID=UPI003D98F37A
MDYEGLVYIGETGRSLRGRIYALRRGIFNGEMPFSDPHTASPSLWTIVDRNGPGFEVSGATPPIVEDKQQRKAVEDVLIALHRWETKTNLVGNFGRMPPGYSKSKTRSTGIRGGRSDDDTLRSFREGVAPLEWENPEEVTDPNWMGLRWSARRPLEDALGYVPDGGGVYRIWNSGNCPPLEYIGESVSLKDRLVKHRRNRDGSLQFSYVPLPDLEEKFQLKQVESELLGAHWLACGEAPVDQY